MDSFMKELKTVITLAVTTFMVGTNWYELQLMDVRIVPNNIRQKWSIFAYKYLRLIFLQAFSILVYIWYGISF